MIGACARNLGPSPSATGRVGGSRWAVLGLGALVGTALLVTACAPDIDEATEEALDSAVKSACAHDFDWANYGGYNDGEDALREILDQANEDHSPYDDVPVLLSTREVTDEMEAVCPEVIEGYGNPPEEPWASESPTVMAEPAPEPSQTPDAGTGTETEGLGPELIDRGLTRGDVLALGWMADSTGYGLSPETPLSFEQATDFAYAIILRCDDAALNDNWEDLIAEDVSMGAPESQARKMNAYIRDEYCTKLN